MSNISANPRLVGHLVNFLVLGFTFVATSLLFSIDTNIGLLFQTILYAAILVTCVHLAKHFLTGLYRSLQGISQQILSNAAGILAGTCIVLIFGQLIAIHGEFIVVIFSSVMAFFVLGTISPLIQKNSSTTL